jgi:hypothetical protein
MILTVYWPDLCPVRHTKCRSHPGLAWGKRIISLLALSCRPLHANFLNPCAENFNSLQPDMKVCVYSFRTAREDPL